MPPYQPVFSISRSQAVRIGRGPGSANVAEFNSGDTFTNLQTGALITPFYANLGDANSRKDLQHHSTLGSLLGVGAPSLTKYSDLYTVSGLVVSAGSGLSVNVSAGVLRSRTYGTSLATAAVTNLALATANATLPRTDLVICNNAGVISVITGAVGSGNFGAAGSNVYEVSALATTGTPTGGTITLQFVYNGFLYTTGTIAYNASAATAATAFAAATGGPNNAVPPTTMTGSGSALGSGNAVLTASAGLTGPITNKTVINNLTGGTNPTATWTTTTAGVGAAAPIPAGSYQVLAQVYVAPAATTPTTIVTGVMQTS